MSSVNPWYDEDVLTKYLLDHGWTKVPSLYNAEGNEVLRSFQFFKYPLAIYTRLNPRSAKLCVRAEIVPITELLTIDVDFVTTLAKVVEWVEGKPFVIPPVRFAFVAEVNEDDAEDDYTIWTSLDGPIKVADMTDSHMGNCINMLRRHINSLDMEAIASEEADMSIAASITRDSIARYERWIVVFEEEFERRKK